MAHSPRPTPSLSTPERRLLSSFLEDGRNNELSHRDALAAAQAQHDRVREAAIRVYELHELKEAHQQIVEQEKKEQERLKAEAALVVEERRLRELRAQTVPKLPPEAAAQAPRRVELAASAPAVRAPATRIEDVKKPEVAQAKVLTPPPVVQNGILSPPSKPEQPPAGIKGLGQPAAASLVSPPVAAVPSPAQPQLKGLSAAQKQVVDRYSEIHQELKKLRKVMQAEAKLAGSPLRGKMGTYRREIRVSIGQLTAGKGANAQPITKITTALKEALDGQVPSPPVQVSQFVLSPRPPTDGAAHNDATLPSLFIYLINICAKGIINQFINECGANPKAADPIGVFAAHIFSHRDFQWRGAPLIDVLMAKFRIVCPVLFGLRGSDRTERGRVSLGWKRDEGGGWISEQSHNDRMTGLGAGFASVALRDFSKSSKANPYPPTHYWRALAGILNSPAGETSNTQYVVLRAMIEGHEQRFLNFYGNAAMAALRLALVDFPNRAPGNATAAQSLQAMAEILRADGLVLG